MHFEMNAMHDDRKKGSLRSVTIYKWILLFHDINACCSSGEREKKILEKTQSILSIVD